MFLLRSGENSHRIVYLQNWKEHTESCIVAEQFPSNANPGALAGVTNAVGEGSRAFAGDVHELGILTNLIEEWDKALRLG
jgi:hypothetical protein